MKAIISFLVGAFASLFLTACGTALQVLDAENSRLMHPWLEGRPTKAAVITRLGDSWKYVDSSKKIYVYPVGPVITQADAESVDTEEPESNAVYELVLIFDDHDRLDRQSVIRVK